jgi:hypothetical protein
LIFLGRGSAFTVVPSVLAAGFLTLACCGCESTAQKSAQIEKLAKHERLALQGVAVTKENPSVRVLQSTVVHSKEGTAVVVELRNVSTRALENAPIEITVRDAKGGTLYQNNQPGEDPSLTRVSLLEPGARTVWVDDQVQVRGAPASASALVGVGTSGSAGTPVMAVSRTRLSSEGGEAGESGTVTNRSQITQQHVAVYAVARKGNRVVAAGRAVLPEVAPGANVPFQVYFVGNPSGARIETNAPPTTF